MKAIFLAAIVIFSGPHFAEARWAELSEAPLLVRDLDRKTSVLLDGTSVDRWSWSLRVQRQDAREDIGTRRIRFYKSFESVKILKARTRTKGVWKEISLNDVQERAADEESPGFSGLSEYILSFPDVQEGSEIEFDYEIRTAKALEPGFWGQNFIVDSGVYEKFRWTVEAPRALSWSLHDPSGVIRGVMSRRRGGGAQVVFRATRPLRMALADEAEAHLANSRKIHLLVSFLPDWKNYGRHAAGEFEKRLQGPLRDEDLSFLRELREVPETETKVQRILRFVHSQLRYFGDWRTSEQMHVPRTLEEIHRTQYGDCKDFALVVARLLREAGIEARPVWILNTEEAPAEWLYRYPTDNAFNHVVLQVRWKDQVRWIDPTNPAARVRYIADEIAGRRGLLMDPKGSELVFIPPVAPEDYLTISEAEVDRDSGGRTEVGIVTRHQGFSAVAAGERLRRDGSVFFIEETAQRLVPSAALVETKADVLDIDPENGDLRESRLRATFDQFWVQTSDGIGFNPVREEVVERFRNLRLTDREGDIYLGRVYAHRESLKLNGVRIVGRRDLSCQVKSPWMDFFQRVESSDEGVLYSSYFVLKAGEIAFEKGVRAAVADLQRRLRECAGRQTILVRRAD